MPTPPSLGLPTGLPLAFDEFTLMWTVFALVLLVGTTVALWLFRSRKRSRNGFANGTPERSITLAPKRGPRRVA